MYSNNNWQFVINWLTFFCYLRNNSLFYMFVFLNERKSKISFFLLQDQVNVLFLVDYSYQLFGLVISSHRQQIFGSLVWKYKEQNYSLDADCDLSEPESDVPIFLASVVSCYFIENVFKNAAKKYSRADQQLRIGSQSSTDFGGRHLFYY